ncbi:ricin-type beta-trefoil lectin domain protein [Glycomyces luteolus]|uniref:Ricin-type beta-trefoil lectin domain protein n=1 Tax=Glycomyces luteolus TaxID=2670330 RepID=A0A9X3PD68_9ACTN|nr:ricin-type beta-trefoil lectin domain protein [Glycomyces luteolus]MDA1361358.1 ricin-type beta-trefoil lectin domain protein [Glycomyces luteolus]
MSRFRSVLACLAAAALMVLSAGATAQAADEPAATADVGAAASSGCGKTPTLTSGTHTIQSSGQNRSFILKIPAGYDNTKPHKLIFGNHWWGGTANDVASGGTDGAVYAHYGLDALANGSAIFVAPQGQNNAWANSNGIDVVFFDDMIRRIEADLCVDESQRFSLGFSYGGAISYALACARPNVFRAVIAIAVPGPVSGCSGGTGAVAYFGIQGVNDSMPNARAMRDRFVANNGCASMSPREPAAGSGTHITSTYSCRAGFPVQWAAFDGGHQQGPVDGCTGCESGARSWVKGEVWRFISQFSSTPPAETDQVKNTGANRCLDVSAQSQSNGATVQLWDCHTGSNQQWVYNTTSKRLSVYGGKCLDAEGAGTSPGTRAIIWDCHGGTNQQWNLNSNGTITGVQSGLCLGTVNNGTGNGTGVVLASCNGSSSQNWSLS